MNKQKNIIRLSMAILLVITMTMSLTSCLFDFEFSYGDYTPDFDGGFDFSDNNIKEEENITSDNYGDLYPGSGSGDTEGVLPLAKTLLSTVTIICESLGSASAGSGIIYQIDKENGDAYIITNQHVVYGATKISVYLYGMHLSSYAIPAVVIGGSVTYDVAVLKIEGSDILANSYACAAILGKSDDVRVYDRVYTVGNAEGGGLSATEGIVSVDSENISITGADKTVISMRVMRVDAAVNHGNSGGGLYNEKGELIGIVSAKEVSEDIDNMGYAIPVDLVCKVANSILYHCNGSTQKQISKALMGVTITAYVTGVEIDDNGNIYKVEIVEVIEISKGSLSENRVMVGDEINSITVDGVKKEVTRVHHVTDAMIDARVGSVVVLNVTRGEENIDITFNITQESMSTVK